jgi:aryl-alcohol dehydrogenase-like predicted oxidoreductase
VCVCVCVCVCVLLLLDCSHHRYMFHWPGIFPENMPMLDPPHIETCGIPVMTMPMCKQGEWSWKKCRLDSWRAMTELQQAGKLRALGVSNFDIRQVRKSSVFFFFYMRQCVCALTYTMQCGGCSV